MLNQKRALLAVVSSLLAVLGGCASRAPYDYTAFKAARPSSILVLPPVNDSPDVGATLSVLAQTTYPLAEAGYYVVPVSLALETFRQNGLQNAPEIHQVSPEKLRKIFGADAALYIHITEYGTKFLVIDSVTTVAAEAQLVDLRSGQTLWKGSARASSDEQRGNSGGGLAVALITAIVKQVVSTTTDAAYPLAGLANLRMLSAGQPNGLLYGPRSPDFGKEVQR